MFSNFLFGITCLMYIVITLISSSKPTTGHVMSDEMTLNALGIGFTICSLILTLTIWWKDGFDWVSQYGIIRILFAVIGCLCMAAATYTCAVLRGQWDWYEGVFPQFLRWLSSSNGLKYMPLLMLVPYFFLLNTYLRANVPPNVYKIPLTIGFGLSVFIALSSVSGWLQYHARQ